MGQGFSLNELAQRLDARLAGDPEFRVTRIASLQTAGPDSISFVSDPAYTKYLADTLAGAVILSPELADQFTGNRLIVSKPYLAYARISSLFDSHTRFEPGIDSSAIVAPDAVLGQGVHLGARVVVSAGAVLGDHVVVGAGTYIGADSCLGEGTRLEANVTVYHSVVIGRSCVIHSGAVIGSDGFGFAMTGEGWQKIHQLGRVIIGDNVEIGANSTLDRGALEDTCIGDGVKIDNLVHVAHNVHIGRHTAIAAQTGIAGSTRIGERCTLAGQVGVIGHLTIVDDVHVSAKSLVTGSILAAGTYAGATPLAPVKEWRKNAVRFRQLDELATRIKRLEKAPKKDA